jgi:diguanylate cyclase (GGDEF)-like protein
VNAATTALVDYLVEGITLTDDRAEAWVSAAELALSKAMTLGEVTNVYLSWRRICTKTVETVGAETGASAEEMAAVCGIVAAGCDTGLVRMARRFESSQLELDTVRAEEFSRLQFQALHDPLTGVANRSLLMDRVHKALQAMDRGRPAPTLLFLDLDNFKAVNDAHGHRLGDEVLTEVARIVSRAIRPTDGLGRFGGDEFVVLCEDLTEPEAQARVIAERIVRDLADLQAQGNPVSVTASIGIAVGRQGEQATDILDRADSDMYRVKLAGRLPADEAS